MEEGGSKAEFPLTHQCLVSGTCLCSAERYQSVARHTSKE